MVYTISTGFAIYFVLWWVVLFVLCRLACVANTRTGRGRRAPIPALLFQHGWVEADLDDDHVVRRFRYRFGCLSCGLFEYRAVIEIDGDAVLKM